MSRTLYPMTQRFIAWFSRPILLGGLLLSIPAFYLLLAGETDVYRKIGHGTYIFSALIIAIDVYLQWTKNRHRRRRRHGKLIMDAIIIVGCVLSGWPTSGEWGVIEWLLRLSLCTVILLRMATLLLQKLKPSHLMQVIGLALLMLSTAGAGFYWLEPNVNSYANGVWLAFTTVATVGYGDIVPSTPASKIFAVFIVLLGYAMFSIVTANIAALFVGEEEKLFEREFHADIRVLTREVQALREELRQRDKIMLHLQEQLDRHEGRE
ncbi:ion transporter [Undibacterium sp. FT147W]|uniref:Ion transporter n=1 Tax=Undibacterium rivi TaxID=2828729 RepID=A0ABS5H163_9BURK|nr:ion channel [Undibacterium rivi]MBR7792446.1 ion transporter [Undibacterium rivi]